jgi:hypothetical protein
MFSSCSWNLTESKVLQQVWWGPLCTWRNKGNCKDAVSGTDCVAWNTCIGTATEYWVFLGRLVPATEISVKIQDMRIEIWNKELPNAKQDRAYLILPYGDTHRRAVSHCDSSGQKAISWWTSCHKLQHKEMFIYQFSIPFLPIDQLNVAIVLCTFILDELGSNLGRIISYNCIVETDYCLFGCDACYVYSYHRFDVTFCLRLQGFQYLQWSILKCPLFRDRQDSPGISFDTM